MSRTRMVIVGAVIVAVAAATALPAMAAPPASDTANQTVKFTNRASVRLTLSVPTVDFGNVDPLATYTQGGGNANVRANANWTLTVTSPANFSDGGANTIPLDRLSLNTNGGGYNAFSAAGGTQTIATGAATSNAGTDNTLSYQLTLQWGDTPSANPYSAALTYTATTP
jgi:hypothetical protein